MLTYLFYILAIVVIIATVLAITEKHPVHAIVYLVTSFFALAMIFYILAAPLIAAFEVIIYAGAVMVLFLFVIMMLDLGHPEKGHRPSFTASLPALILAGVLISALIAIITRLISSPQAVNSATGVHDFAKLLFTRYGVAVEIISMQLLFAVVGALYLGRRKQ